MATSTYQSHDLDNEHQTIEGLEITTSTHSHTSFQEPQSTIPDLNIEQQTVEGLEFATSTQSYTSLQEPNPTNPDVDIKQQTVEGLEFPTSTQSSYTSLQEPNPTNPDVDIEQQTVKGLEFEVFDNSSRPPWLRAAVLSASGGLLSMASFVGAFNQDDVILAGIAQLIAGTCSRAVVEFVSVCSQNDIKMAQIKREVISQSEMEEKKAKLPSPLKQAAATAAGFAVGAFGPMVPAALAATFIKNYGLMLGVVVAAVSLVLLGFGGLSVVLGRAPMVLGRAPVVKSSFRLLVGGWFAILFTHLLYRSLI